MAEDDRDILDLIEAGRKIEAIKLAREHLGMGLAEAKAFVEGLAEGGGGGVPSGRLGAAPSGAPSPGRPVEDWGPIDAALRSRRKIEAVKAYREWARCGLKEAKDAVELRAVEIGLQSRPSKCFVATAAWGGGEQAEVAALRRFRNRVLRRRWWGRAVIGGYERVSPGLAWAVRRSELLAAAVRVGVRLAVRGGGSVSRACRPWAARSSRRRCGGRWRRWWSR